MHYGDDNKPGRTAYPAHLAKQPDEISDMVDHQPAEDTVERFVRVGQRFGQFVYVKHDVQISVLGTRTGQHAV